jgi:hypothetical protein
MFLLAMLPACTHISGVVEQAPGQPLQSAVISVGRPDGIAVYSKHQVDSRGRFDIQLAPTDETNVYVYDGAGDPRMTMRRLEPIELKKNMRIMVRPAMPNSELMP